MFLFREHYSRLLKKESGWLKYIVDEIWFRGGIFTSGHRTIHHHRCNSCSAAPWGGYCGQHAPVSSPLTQNQLFISKLTASSRQRLMNDRFLSMMYIHVYSYLCMYVSQKAVEIVGNVVYIRHEAPLIIIQFIDRFYIVFFFLLLWSHIYLYNMQFIF